MKKNFYTKQKGFTLVEVLVATMIFTLVMTIAISSLVAISGANKKTQAMRAVTDGLNFALENMTRSLRLGKDYTCVSGSGSSCSAISFTAFDGDDKGEIVQYGIDISTRQLIRTNSAGRILMLPPEVNVKDVRFDISNTFPDGTSAQPRVRVFLEGSIQVKGEITDFAIQTLVAQRQID
jgi:prepilin-type N-terminal cleavage/methylation domain-containing protein